jgi:glycosyltransferase involved in cell wall biosynthesis
VVSIIIPVYNAEKYIAKCLEAFVSQTYDDLEIICVDDGSSDSSANIIKEFAKKYSNIIYLFQQNSGAPMARNTGFEVCKGEYCIFFDADDLMNADGIEKMVEKADSNNADLCIGNYCEINEVGKIIRNSITKKLTTKSKNKWDYAIFAPLPGTKLIRRDIIIKNKLKFVDVKIGQDLNFYLKLMACVNSIVSIESEVMQYRVIEGSISRTYTMNIIDIVQSIEDIKRYYKVKGLTKEYKNYISIIELIAYRSQMEKYLYFNKNTDKKKLIDVLSNYSDQIKYPGKNYINHFLKEKIKILYIKYKIKMAESK